MATRENLKKLSIDNLRELAKDLNINTTKVKKDDLVGTLLVHNVAETSLTPVRAVSEATNIGPGASGNENLPPFLSVHYSPLPPTFFESTPKPSFATIYSFMILRSRDDGGSVKNFRGLDRSVKHFDSGDIHEICFSRIDEVTFYIKCFCLASMKKQRYQVYVCVTVSADQKTMTIDFAYCQCPIGPLLLAMRKMVFTSDNIPPVEISTDLVTFIEKETCDQRQNQMWKDLHIGRITSSLFGDVLRCNSSQENLVKQILEGSSLDRYPQLPKAIQWGVDMEDRARQEYLTFQKAFKGDITVLPTGLTLYPHMSSLVHLVMGRF
ncbi:unnamed protein product [Mytilus coruscus]|uniref:Rho termination factor N-terminal domain-containing protein n=1 Tax=Mytilus coruscus TaxID=42192 RepID=A0A6J8E8U8_MYTCO|nr:unnamed protein product [Mytilus coruscus]